MAVNCKNQTAKTRSKINHKTFSLNACLTDLSMPGHILYGVRLYDMAARLTHQLGLSSL